MSIQPNPTEARPIVVRWETEIPLLILVALASIALWIFIAISIIGIFYAVFLGIFFFLAHVGFIAHLRGSSIKLGPDQMPELYARVEAMAAHLQMKKTPEAYLMQAGGSLNALATKLFGANFIVLYSDLLEACGEDEQAADFIIAHELGHLKAGHLRFQWFLLPGRFIPFLGSAYSRAREYTADRYGFSQTRDPRAATRGLTILAAGGAHAPRVNFEAMVRQRHDLNTVWMTLGRWMSTHPPLVDRIAELDRALAPQRIVGARAALGAAAIVAFGFLIPLAGGGYLFKKFMDKAKLATEAAQAAQAPTHAVVDVPAATERARKELRTLADVAERYRARTGHYPEEDSDLFAAWRLENPTAEELSDPFDGSQYGYSAGSDSYVLWSSGSGDPWNLSSLQITGASGAQAKKE